MPKLKCGKCNEVSDAKYLGGWLYKCDCCEAINTTEKLRQGVEKSDRVLFDDEKNKLTVQEWAGLDYQDYIGYILAYLNTHDFNDLSASNDDELMAGYLSDEQVSALRKTLKKGITDNWTMLQIMKEIKDKVKPGDLTVQLANDNVRVIDEDSRIMNIARSETTRVVNNGSLLNFRDANVERVKFSATVQSGRTCELCEGMDGDVYDIDDAEDEIPVHTSCRCLWIPIILEEE